MHDITLRYVIRRPDQSLEALTMPIEDIERINGVVSENEQVLSRDLPTGLRAEDGTDAYENDVIELTTKEPFRGRIQYWAPVFIVRASNSDYRTLDGKNYHFRILGHAIVNPDLIESGTNQKEA